METENENASAPPADFEPVDISNQEGMSFGEALLDSRYSVFEMIHQQKKLNDITKYFLMRTLLFSAIYGFCLGFFALNWQILSAAVKVPLLIVGTTAICLPALFTFNVLLGSKLNIRQTLAVLLVSNYLLSLVLVSLAPILLFFIISTPDKSFIFLLNLIAFVISGIFGVSLLWKGMRYLTFRSGIPYNPQIIQVWSVIYMFVGTQLSWLLRPYIGNKGEFAFFREIEGNFYIAVYKVIVNILDSGF